MRRVHRNLCLATIIASIMATNMWKNSLKNVESDNNKIIYENLTRSFLQRNSTYCLNKRRNYAHRCFDFISLRTVRSVLKSDLSSQYIP